MSLAQAVRERIQPHREPARTRERHLRAVEGQLKARKPRIAYAITALVGIVLIGAAQMGLSLATTATTYEIRDLNSLQHDLSLQAQILNEEITGLSSPQYLAANAAASGMVVGASPTYLRLSDGAVIGTSDVAMTSTVNVLSTFAVPNSLIANTPLATAPGTTIGGAIPVAESPVQAQQDVPVVAEVIEPQLPPVISDGIPTPETR